MENGDEEPATVEQALSMIEARPDDAMLYQYLGSLYLKRYDLNQAWKAYMQSLLLNPDDPWSCLKFGNLLAILDDKSYARELFDYAIVLAPEIPAVHWCSADLYRKEGEQELAELGYQKAVEADPDDEQAQGKLVARRIYGDEVRGASPASDT